LFSQIVVQREKLAAHVRQTLQDRVQVTLLELCQLRPLEFGLAELLAYLQLTDDSFAFRIDEKTVDLIQWQSIGETGSILTKRGRMPRVIFSRYP
jgi:translation elongation factor EF-1beta